MLLGIVLLLGAMWGLRSVLPSGFMPGDYAIWHAKLGLVRRCALSPTIILGDSRATAGIDPAILRGSVNLSLTGGGPIEAFYLLSDIERGCPKAPPSMRRRIIVSFISNHFVNDKLFWPYSASFGLLDRHDIDEVLQLSRTLGDPVVLAPTTRFDLDGKAAAFFYGWRFPTSYAGNLIEGGLVRRYAANHALERETLQAKGYHSVGTDRSFAGISGDAREAAFRPSPLLSAYFEKLVGLAGASGAEIVFVHAPINPASAAAMSPALRQGFSAYLDRVGQAYPRFTVLDPAIPTLPANMFGDHDLHLNRAGATRFSQMLASRMAARSDEN